MTIRSTPSDATCSTFAFVIPPSTASTSSRSRTREIASAIRRSVERNEGLTAPTRIDREQQQQLELVEQRLDRSDLGARVQSDAADDTAACEALKHPVGVPGRLEVKGEDVRAGIDVGPDLVERFVDHQMDVLDEALRDRLDQRGAGGQRRTEHAVHHVDVGDPDPGLVECLQLLSEPQQIGGEDADAQLRGIREQPLRIGLHPAATTASRARSWKYS